MWKSLAATRTKKKEKKIPELHDIVAMHACTCSLYNRENIEWNSPEVDRQVPSLLGVRARLHFVPPECRHEKNITRPQSAF